jgi:hypothetical protein
MSPYDAITQRLRQILRPRGDETLIETAERVVKENEALRECLGIAISRIAELEKQLADIKECNCDVCQCYGVGACQQDDPDWDPQEI